MKTLDLAPRAAVPVEHAQAKLGKVGHEYVGKVNQGRAPFHRIERDDWQRHQDRVGIILLDRLIESRASRSLVTDVPTDELDAITGTFEGQDHLIIANGMARLRQAARNGHGYEQGLIELVRSDLAVQMVTRFVEGEEAVDLLGTLGDLVEVAEVAGRSAAPRPPVGHSR